MQVVAASRRGPAFRVLLGLSVLLLARPSAAQELKVEEKTLSNGMRLLLVPRHDEPTVSGGWVAHVGSANERPGITGISHLFEHMMFKGTPTIGTKDYKKDLEIISEQERVRGEMRAEETKMRVALRKGDVEDLLKPENKTARYKELEGKFDALIKAQREVLVKNEFDRAYTKQGGSGMNAFTNEDMTGYFITVPKNKLELWMWMESDRLKNPVFREFYAERDVVFEERRMRTESTPTGRLEEAFDEMFWHGHPYSWPVVGYPSDIPAITKAQADEYYSLFYAPNNLTAILVGDFDPKAVVAQAEQYFGRIPRGKVEPPEMTTQVPKWEAEMRFLGEAETNPQVAINWHTVPFQHRDAYALEVLAQILNGRTGRLYKGLVLPADAVATNVTAGQISRKYAGGFAVEGEAKDGKTPEDVEKAVYVELEKLKASPVDDHELQKVKNNFAAGAFRRLSSNFPILVQLIRNDGYGDWHELNDGPKRIQAVTAADVQRVAKTYLTKENRAVAVFTRKGGGQAVAEDPAIAALPEAMRPMIKQNLQKIATENDIEKLKGMAAKMEAQSGQVPAEMKGGFDLMANAVRARLAELGKGTAASAAPAKPATEKPATEKKPSEKK
ncbi:MAG: pitrilysin family protein [Thermoanaerobaculia bacterium]